MAWYKCNITHDVRQEDGSLKIDVTEPYVFEAQSVTEAAARLAAHLEGETYTLEGVTRMRLQVPHRGSANGSKEGGRGVSPPPRRGE